MPVTPYETREKLIDASSGGRGYSFLTQGQKEQIDSAVSQIPASPVSTLSSTDGEKKMQEIQQATTLPEPTKTDSTTTPTPTEKAEADILQSESDALKTDLQKQAESSKASLKATLDPIRSQADVALQAQLDQIEREYGQVIAKQQEINARSEKTAETIQIRGGTARYAPEAAMGAVNAVISEGQNKLSELYGKKAAARANVQNAYSEKKYTLALKEYDAFQQIDKDMRTEVNKINENLLKAKQEQAKVERVNKIEDVVSNSVLLGNLDKNTLYRTLRLAGYDATTKEVDDAYNNIIPKEVASSDVSADERIFKQMKTEGVLPPEATMFDYWKKKDEAMRDPKASSPELQLLRELMIQEKQDKLQNYITFSPKNQKDFDYSDAFGSAVSNASMGEAQIRGRKFSDLMERGEYQQAREFIFQTALETSLADTYKEVSGAANTLKSISDFKKFMAEMVEAGVPTNIVSGTAEDIVRKLGETTNPKYVAFKAKMSKILFDYRKAMTGVQFSFEEGEQYKDLFPQYKNNITINSELINSITASLTSQVDNFYSRKLGSTLYSKLASEGASSAFGVQSDTQAGQYDDMKAQLQEGEILIERNGEVGAVPESEFDPLTDTKL